MDQLPAFYKRKCAPLHPFNMCQLRYFLRDTFLASRYPTILRSFETGFLVGIPPIKFTFAPTNSATIQSLYSHFVDIINKEFSLQRYLGPFSELELKYLLGPFQTSPLSLVPKPHSTNYRLIQNLSFPHTNTPVPSINAHINAADYPCTFGTFLTICLIINDLPPGSQASTRDVADAYRTIPLHPSQWPGLVIRLDSQNFAINTQNSFGLASAGGVWGHVADFLADLFRSHGIGPLSKWVDDFIFFRLPKATVPLANCQRQKLRSSVFPQQHNARSFFLGPTQPDGSISEYDECFHFPLICYPDPFFSYNADHIDSLSQAIGLPWHSEKTQGFSSSAVYLGFIWDLDSRTVSLQPSKQLKYRNNLLEWQKRSKHTLIQVQSLYGKLLHTTYLLPHGRLYLTGLERMIPTFRSHPDRPHFPEKSIKADLQWWLTQLDKTTITRPIPSFAPFDNLCAYSDASTKAIGICIGNSWATFAYSSEFKQCNLDIVWAEAVGIEILLCALTFFPITTHRILVFCDNAVVANGWQIGRSRNKNVNEVFKRISSFLATLQTEIQIKYIPSEENPADAPSRGELPLGPSLPNFPLPKAINHVFQRVLHPHHHNFYPQLRPIHPELLPAPIRPDYTLRYSEFDL